MKQILLLLTCLTFFGLSVNAKGVIPFCTDCEYIQTVEELPAEGGYVGENGEALHVGYFYKQFWAVWIPIWNFEGRYCLTDAENTTYYDISEEELNTLAAEQGFSLPSNPISFWNKIGGKILLVLIIGGLIFMKVNGDDEDEEETPVQEAEPA